MEEIASWSFNYLWSDKFRTKRVIQKEYWKELKQRFTEFQQIPLSHVASNKVSSQGPYSSCPYDAELPTQCKAL